MVRQAGATLALGLTMMGFASSAMAQHAIYKCVQGGKVVYSNEPCLDAKKIEIKQTKGVNYEGRGSGGAPKR
ncbi:DUF4124 domain-containing protein [Variovorax sp. ZT5P49]